MVSLRFALAAAAVLVCASVDVSVTSSLAFDASKNRPVTKVITLLQDMLKQLEKEGAEDEEIYDKMACWCETNDKEKTKSIAEANAKIEDLGSSIEEKTAGSARLTTEIANLEKEVEKNQAALNQADAIRRKQKEEFNGEEKDLLQSISALKAAIVVLSKHHSFMQIPKSHVLGVAATLQHELDVHTELLKGVLTKSDHRAIAAFIQNPTFKQAYAPQSGEIFGILKNMKDSFESNLSQSQQEELASQKAFADLKAAKIAEISAGQEQLNTKQEQLADTDQRLAQSKQDLDDTKASLDADTLFLANLKEKCSMTDAEWEQRQKTRGDEMKAVSQALAFLSSDDAHDMFTRTFNPSFLQKGGSSVRTRASKVLQNAAKKLQSPHLANIALQVRLDAFVKVKEAIDKMIADLQKEGADEIKHRDYCIGALHENELSTESGERDKQDLEAKVADLKSQIETLTTEIKTLEGEVAEMQIQLKRAGEDRELENKAFQTTIADQRATQALLKKAKEMLQGFYEQSFVQQGPPPPPGFNAYKNQGGSGVIGLLTQIINDAKTMENEAITAETDAQKAYESFVKDTNNSITAKQRELVNKNDLKATTEGALVTTEKDLEDKKTDLEILSNEKADLKSSCDFTISNFEIRQTARKEEIEALNQAKSILSGADFN